MVTAHCHPDEPPYRFATGAQRTPYHDTVLDLTIEGDSYPDVEQAWCTVCGSLYYADSRFQKATWHAPKEVGAHIRPRITMNDLEDICLLFMNTKVDRGFARAVMVNWFCQMNNIEPKEVEADIDAWAAKTAAKWAAKESR